VPERQKVVDRLSRAPPMRRRHRGDPVAERHERIDDHDRIVVDQRALELVARLLGQDDERAISHVGQLRQQLDLACMLMPGRSDRQPQAVFVDRVRNAGQDGPEVHVVTQRHQDREDAAA
jgi:hypothetical protein